MSESLFKGLPFFPDAASTMAWEVDALYLFTVSLTIVVAAGVFAAMVAFAIIFRRKSEDEVPKPIHGSVPLEIVWSVIPFVITMGLFGWGAWVYFKFSAPPRDAMDVHVVGKQWMWKLQHPEGKREINELHVPIGQPVRIILTSEDVLHSFFIPAFRVKRDAVPGRYATMWFEATKLGEFHLFCAEYCGNEHSRMIGKVVVMDPTDYDRWLHTETGETPADAGKRLFSEMRCDTCHSRDGVGRAPSLTGIFGTSVTLQSGERARVDEAYIRESILDPKHAVVSGFQPTMPTFQGQITEEQVFELITYIRTLGEE